MTTQSILKQRVSSRDFSNQKVAIDDIKAIIAEAQLAPSWENSQPWKAYVATGKTLEAIKKWHFDNVTNGVKSWVDIMPPQEWHIHAKDNIAAWEKATQNDLGEKGWQDFWSAQSHFFNAPAVVTLLFLKIRHITQLMMLVLLVMVFCLPPLSVDWQVCLLTNLFVFQKKFANSWKFQKKKVC